jgi:hypothetical protein
MVLRERNPALALGEVDDVSFCARDQTSKCIHPLSVRRALPWR